VPSDPNARVVERSGDSDIGRERSTNQDRLLATAPLFAVADGMGGHAGGAIAAAIAVSTFEERASLCNEMSPVEALKSLITEANRRIRERAAAEPGYEGMGTTIISALVHDDAVTTAHVGDSRAYRVRGAAIERLTDDHSMVEELLKLGALTEEEAEHHPQRSIVTRSLGTREAVKPDITTHVARDGDVYLLCSDGLTKMLSETEIGATLAKAPSLDEAGERLIKAANERGGKDNITVCLFRLAIDETAKRRDTTVIDQAVIARAATAQHTKA
jgi:serine/threonine protein phosphatase PrpC